MKVYGRTSVSEFLGDRLVYRNLKPQDERLPALAALRGELGLAPDSIPRKSEADYARVIVRMLQAARALDAPRADIRRLLFIGDTRLNDGTAFANLCVAGDWPGLGFIGADRLNQPAAVEVLPAGGGGRLFLANRWTALQDGPDSFAAFCKAQDFPIDEHTAVVFDLDKTALGARGRNDAVIDGARVQAVETTVAGLLGPEFDRLAFLRAYETFKVPEYHSFTRDNQDYLAYLCLMLGSGLYELDELVRAVDAGEIESFRAFIDAVQTQQARLDPDLRAIHAAIYANVQAGDPTPFKTFRRNEYLATIGRMGHLGDDQPLERLLAEEIVLTQEVRRLALDWAAQGALTFGLSDKPDEASVPTSEQAQQGYRPIHRQVTHAVGV